MEGGKRRWILQKGGVEKKKKLPPPLGLEVITVLCTQNNWSHQCGCHMESLALPSHRCSALSGQYPPITPKLEGKSPDSLPWICPSPIKAWSTFMGASFFFFFWEPAAKLKVCKHQKLYLWVNPERKTSADGAAQHQFIIKYRLLRVGGSAPAVRGGQFLVSTKLLYAPRRGESDSRPAYPQGEEKHWLLNRYQQHTLPVFTVV